jgi:hypothetical protein
VNHIARQKEVGEVQIAMEAAGSVQGGDALGGQPQDACALPEVGKSLVDPIPQIRPAGDVL